MKKFLLQILLLFSLILIFPIAIQAQQSCVEHLKVCLPKGSFGPPTPCCDSTYVCEDIGGTGESKCVPPKEFQIKGEACNNTDKKCGPGLQCTPPDAGICEETAQTPAVPGGTDDYGDLEKSFTSQLECGAEGQACCNSDLHIPPPQQRFESVPEPLGTALRVTIGPIINTLLRGLTTVFVRTEDLINKHLMKRPPCIEGLKENRLPDPRHCRCERKDMFNIINLCQAIPSTGEQELCRSCSTHGVWTAIGCVDFKFETFLKEKVFGFGVGLAGMIALLCIIYAAFTMQTSGGNPEKVKKAQEMLTSCIIGLILIIFSVFILRVIGVDILRIPGFGK